MKIKLAKKKHPKPEYSHIRMTLSAVGSYGERAHLFEGWGKATASRQPWSCVSKDRLLSPIFIQFLSQN